MSELREVVGELLAEWDPHEPHSVGRATIRRLRAAYEASEPEPEREEQKTVLVATTGTIACATSTFFPVIQKIIPSRSGGKP